MEVVAHIFIILTLVMEALILISFATHFSFLQKIEDVNDFIDEAIERRREIKREARRKKLEKESDELCERDGYKRQEVYYK